MKYASWIRNSVSPLCEGAVAVKGKEDTMEEAAVKTKDKRARHVEIKRKQDEFLDVYSLYLETGLQWIKEEAILKAYELHMLDQNFSFAI